MANGFKDYDGFTPNRFICKAPAGNDSNNGLTKDTPRVTPPSGAGIILQIGSGVYTFGNLVVGQLRGDGKTIIDFNNSQLTFNGLVANVTLLRLGEQRADVAARPLQDVIIKNSNFSCSSRIGTYTTSVFINNNITVSVSSSGILFNRSIVVNSIFTAYSFEAYTLNNSYLDFNSEINLNTFSKFSYSNIEGVISIHSSYFSDNILKKYAIQDQLTGTPQDNGYAAGVNWLTESQLTSDGYNGTIIGWDNQVATCINRDPKFNNVALEDFSLQADSPHIGRAVDGNNIGGTNIANTILVNQNGVGTIEVLPQPEIDTTNPNFYIVDLNEDEGYIDFIQRIGTQPIVLNEIEPISTLEFDSDITGGGIGNRNVPDSEPLTLEYPRKLTTTSLAPNTTTLNVIGHGVIVGEFVRVLGEDREVTAVTTDTITVGTAFRAAVASGVIFQVGDETQLAALKPNRLTYQLRVSTQVNKPETDVEWDNNIDPIYNYAGIFSTQEWFEKPGYVIDGSNVFGSGDSQANPAIIADEIAATWINVRVWLRNNYDS